MPGGGEFAWREDQRPIQPVSWRLCLPAEWITGTERRQHAGIPTEAVYQSKNELALGVLDQVLGWELKRGVILADEAYGGSFGWRAALRERGLFYAVRVPWTTTGWPQTPEFFAPEAQTRKGRPATRLRSSSPLPKSLREIARELPESAWSEVIWREGSKGPQRSRFAQLPLWAAHGWRQGPQPERIREVALMERPADEEAPTRYWLSLLPESLPLHELVAAAKARWRIEQDYRELKEELGLDHFEGRGWLGLAPPRGTGHGCLCLPAPGTTPETPLWRGKKPATTSHPAARATASPGRSHPSLRPMSLVSHPLQTA